MDLLDLHLNLILCNIKKVPHLHNVSAAGGGTGGKGGSGAAGGAVGAAKGAGDVVDVHSSVRKVMKELTSQTCFDESGTLLLSRCACKLRQELNVGVCVGLCLCDIYQACAYTRAHKHAHTHVHTLMLHTYDTDFERAHLSLLSNMAPTLACQVLRNVKARLAKTKRRDHRSPPLFLLGALQVYVCVMCVRMYVYVCV